MDLLDDNAPADFRCQTWINIYFLPMPDIIYATGVLHRDFMRLQAGFIETRQLLEETREYTGRLMERSHHVTHPWQLRFIYFCSLPILSLRLDQAIALDRATVFGALQFDLIFQLLCEATACLPQSAHPHRCNEILLIFFLGVHRISQHWSWHEVHGHDSTVFGCLGHGRVPCPQYQNFVM